MISFLNKKNRVVSVYTRDGFVGSSSYYRIWQYFSKMQNVKIQRRIFIPTWLTCAQYNTIHSTVKGKLIRVIYHFFVSCAATFFFAKDSLFVPDCVVLLRSVTPKSFFFPINLLYEFMLLRTRLVIWDVDDDIVASEEITQGEKELIEKYADTIVLTHEGLLKILQKQNRKKAIFACTTDGDFECDDWSALERDRVRLYEKEFRVLWLTSSAGFVDIKKIETVLDSAAITIKKNTGKQMVLVVVCNKPYLKNFKELKVENHLWNRQSALSYLKTSHVGIMPLKKTRFALGKGSFKVIQYYSASLPVIASKVGFNCRVVENECTGFLIEDDVSLTEWIKAFEMLARSEKMLISMGRNAREAWLSKYSYCKNFNQWVELVNG